MTDSSPLSDSSPLTPALSLARATFAKPSRRSLTGVRAHARLSRVRLTLTLALSMDPG